MRSHNGSPIPKSVFNIHTNVYLAAFWIVGCNYMEKKQTNLGMMHRGFFKNTYLA